jgi:hypothetical protein
VTSIKTRTTVASLLRNMRDALLPNAHDPKASTPGQLVGLVARSVLAAGAEHLAQAVEQEQCGLCRDVAIMRKPHGIDEWLYRCSEHGGLKNEGWEEIKADD